MSKQEVHALVQVPLFCFNVKLHSGDIRLHGQHIVLQKNFYCDTGSSSHALPPTAHSV